MAATFGSAALGFGTLEGWDIQNSDANDENKRANVLGPTGNETASNVFDDTQQVTTTYKANTAAPTVPATLGADVNGVTLTQIQLSTDSEDWATMTLTGHAHTDGTHGTCRTVAHGISLTAGFGASAFGVTGGESVRTGECTISCDHYDEPDGVGDTVAGENYNPRIEITVKVLGSGATLPEGYDRTTNPTSGTNTTFQYETISGIKALEFT